MDSSDMSSIDIRAALESDLSDIQSCTRQAYAKYIARIGREPAPMQADVKSQIDKGCIDVAFLGSRLAGYVVFYPEGNHIHLENVAVLPEYAGRGIGKRLIEHVERVAKASGFEAVTLYTNEAMTENLALYPAIGYLKTATRREAGFNRVYFRKQV